MKKILIIIDMQNDFINGSLPAFGGQKIVCRVAEKLQQEWDQIYVTMDSHYLETYGNTIEGQRIPMHCIGGSDGWKLVKEIGDLVTGKDHDRTRIIEKRSFADVYEIPAWIDLYYEKIPNWNQTNFEIEICGVCTDICVISNALVLRSAFPHAKIIVDANCCAGTSDEAHKAALTVMRNCLIDVINE